MKCGLSKQIRKALAKDHACFVLVTCSEPDKEGHMEVEMNYEGDSMLAAYLLQSAQKCLDERVCLEEEPDLTNFISDESRHIN